MSGVGDVVAVLSAPLLGQDPRDVLLQRWSARQSRFRTALRGAYWVGREAGQYVPWQALRVIFDADYCRDMQVAAYEHDAERLAEAEVEVLEPSFAGAAASLSEDKQQGPGACPAGPQHTSVDLTDPAERWDAEDESPRISFEDQGTLYAPPAYCPNCGGEVKHSGSRDYVCSQCPTIFLQDHDYGGDTGTSGRGGGDVRPGIWLRVDPYRNKCAWCGQLIGYTATISACGVPGRFCSTYCRQRAEITHLAERQDLAGAAASSTLNPLPTGNSGAKQQSDPSAVSFARRSAGPQHHTIRDSQIHLATHHITKHRLRRSQHSMSCLCQCGHEFDWGADWAKHVAEAVVDALSQ